MSAHEHDQRDDRRDQGEEREDHRQRRPGKHQQPGGRAPGNSGARLCCMSGWTPNPRNRPLAPVSLDWHDISSPLESPPADGRARSGRCSCHQLSARSGVHGVVSVTSPSWCHELDRRRWPLLRRFLEAREDDLLETGGERTPADLRRGLRSGPSMMDHDGHRLAREHRRGRSASNRRRNRASTGRNARRRPRP